MIWLIWHDPAIGNATHDLLMALGCLATAGVLLLMIWALFGDPED